MIYSALVQVNLWHSMISTMQKKAKKRREKRMAEIEVIHEIKERRQRKWEEFTGTGLNCRLVL